MNLFCSDEADAILSKHIVGWSQQPPESKMEFLASALKRASEKHMSTSGNIAESVPSSTRDAAEPLPFVEMAARFNATK